MQDWMAPLLSQPQMRMVRVPVLLRGGGPLSTTKMGSKYTSCSWRLKLTLCVCTAAVLSAGKKQTTAKSLPSQSSRTSVSSSIHGTNPQDAGGLPPHTHQLYGCQLQPQTAQPSREWRALASCCPPTGAEPALAPHAMVPWQPWCPGVSGSAPASALCWQRAARLTDSTAGA